MTTEQTTLMALMAGLNSRFVQSITYINDATPDDVKNSGWGTRGKEAWIASIVAAYRADVHKILGD